VYKEYHSLPQKSEMAGYQQYHALQYDLTGIRLHQPVAVMSALISALNPTKQFL
jgi:hypothetical protein